MFCFVFFLLENCKKLGFLYPFQGDFLKKKSLAASWVFWREAKIFERGGSIEVPDWGVEFGILARTGEGGGYSQVITRG